MNPEKYLPVKGLVSEMKDRLGLTVSERFVRAMLKAGVPRFGNNARLSELMEWWKAHPGFSPRAKKKAA